MSDNSDNMWTIYYLDTENRTVLDSWPYPGTPREDVLESVRAELTRAGKPLHPPYGLACCRGDPLRVSSARRRMNAVGVFLHFKSEEIRKLAELERDEEFGLVEGE